MLQMTNVSNNNAYSKDLLSYHGIDCGFGLENFLPLFSGSKFSGLPR